MSLIFMLLSKTESIFVNISVAFLGASLFIFAGIQRDKFKKTLSDLDENIEKNIIISNENNAAFEYNGMKLSEIKSKRKKYVRHKNIEYAVYILGAVVLVAIGFISLFV